MKWQENNSWSVRMSAFQWRGNPKAEIKPLDQCVYTKKIYTGNLQQNTKISQVTKCQTNICSRNQSRNHQQCRDVPKSGGVDPIKEIEVNEPRTRDATVHMCSADVSPRKTVDEGYISYPPKIQQTVWYWKGLTP